MVSENLKKIIEHKKKTLLLEYYLKRELKGKLISKVEYAETALGERVIIYCAKPRLVLGRNNENLEKIEFIAKNLVGLKNPKIDAVAVENPLLDAEIVADLIASQIERLGNSAARNIALKIMKKVLDAGALGIEVRITGKVIGDRSMSIRLQKGYIKKSGELNKLAKKAVRHAKLPSGVIGVQVRILRPDVTLYDRVTIKEVSEIQPEELEKIDPSLLEKFKKKFE